MHFLDHVFPLEYPFYNPSIFDGGRGWILFLLMRMKPLYHAVLNISAYHHSALIRAKNSTCKFQTWNELQKHHTLALQELHQDMEELCGSRQDNLDESIDVLASIVQMISFEVTFPNTYDRSGEDNDGLRCLWANRIFGERIFMQPWRYSSISRAKPRLLNMSGILSRYQ